MFERIIPKALSDLMLPGVLKIMFFCVVGYVFCWIGLSWLFMYVAGQFAGAGGWTGTAAHLFAGFAGTIIAWLCFPLLYPILISFFVESISRTIEKEDYPALPEPNPPFWPTFWQDLGFTAKAALLNILCLPLYLIPLVNIAVYYTLNGYILGRQFFCMAAGRRTSYAEAQSLMRQHRGTLFLLGAGVMFCATLPIIGLVAPVLGVAIMLHLFHELKGTPQVIAPTKQP